MARTMRKAQAKAQRDEYERKQAAKRDHLKALADERRAARAAVRAQRGPTEPWPVHPTAKRG